MSRQHSSLMIMSEAFGVLHDCTLGFSASLELSFPPLPQLFFFSFFSLSLGLGALDG